MKPMTRHRDNRTGERILYFIKQFQDEHGFPPTTREITAGVGMNSTSTIHRWLKIYASQNVVSWIPGQARTVQIVKYASNHTPDAEKDGTGEI
jgi:repressor LexA